MIMIVFDDVDQGLLPDFYPTPDTQCRRVLVGGLHTSCLCLKSIILFFWAHSRAAGFQPGRCTEKVLIPLYLLRTLWIDCPRQKLDLKINIILRDLMDG